MKTNQLRSNRQIIAPIIMDESKTSTIFNGSQSIDQAMCSSQTVHASVNDIWSDKLEDKIEPPFEGIAKRQTKGTTLETRAYDVQFKVKYETTLG